MADNIKTIFCSTEIREIPLPTTTRLLRRSLSNVEAMSTWLFSVLELVAL